MMFQIRYFLSGLNSFSLLYCVLINVVIFISVYLNQYLNILFSLYSILCIFYIYLLIHTYMMEKE